MQREYHIEDRIKEYDAMQASENGAFGRLNWEQVKEEKKELTQAVVDCLVEEMLQEIEKNVGCSAGEATAMVLESLKSYPWPPGIPWEKK